MLIKDVISLLEKQGEIVSISPQNEVFLQNAEFFGLSYDDRRCRAGDLFFCKGDFKKEYIFGAVKKGAAAALRNESEDFELFAGIPEDFTFITVKNVKKCMALISAFFYGYPIKKLTSIAVTGTKGKSSTVNMLKDAFRQAGSDGALLSDFLPSDTPHLTTPEAPDLHRAAYLALKSGVSHLIFEVSSQAEKEMRTYGILFDCACFLNFGSDHQSPSEHKSEEEYFLCKLSLLLHCKKAVVNRDTPVFDRIISAIAEKNARQNDPETEIVTFSASGQDCDYKVGDYRPTPSGSRFTVKEKDGGKYSFCLTKPGKFNMENALAAVAVLRTFSVGYENIFGSVLTSFCEGRQEYLTTRDGKITVVTDYAHNKMSFEAIFGAVKETFPKAKITAVFGCPGKKAYQRRRDLPEAALKYADRMIICEEDSGKEDFCKIRDEILENITRASPSRAASVSVIKERETAIKTAVKNAFENGENRVIVVTGKGRETFMTEKSGNVPIKSDYAAAAEAIEECNKAIGSEAVFSELKKQKNKKLFVYFEDGAKPEAFAAALVYLLRAGTETTVFCRGKTSSFLKNHCFENGFVFGKEAFFPESPVRFPDHVEKDVIIRRAKAEKPDFFAYISKTSGIMIEEKKLSGNFHLSDLSLILSVKDSSALGFIYGVCRTGGCACLAVSGDMAEKIPCFLCSLPVGEMTVVPDDLTPKP